MSTDDQDPRAILTAPLTWQAALASKWQALGREILGLHTGPRRKLSEVARECQSLAVVAAWFESQGNITHAALRLGASRRALRDRIVDWRHRHPELVPRAAGRSHEPGEASPEPVHDGPSTTPRRRRRKPRAAQSQPEGDTP